jgi:predicted alpha/beta superfamily hydrolase
MIKFSVKVVIFYVIFGVIFAPLSNAQEEFKLNSENMQGDREIVVHFPKNYDSSNEAGYPVIYMLDAGTKDKMVAEIANYYNWAEVMPEVIVVGLKNVNRGVDFLPGYYGYEYEGKRYSGNGTKLLGYIKDELIPFVDSKFKTNGNNVFVGHSWAGQFVTYSMSQTPSLFKAYFITSPDFGRHGSKTFDALEKALTEDQASPNFVYLSVGGDEEQGLRSDYHRLTALLQKHLPDQVRLHHEVHSSAIHNSNGAISLPKALQLYFVAS